MIKKVYASFESLSIAVKNKKERADALSFLLVRREGLVCIFLPMGEKQRCSRRRAGGCRQSAGLSDLVFRVPFYHGIKQKRESGCSLFFVGTPKGTRTPDLLIRSQSLYPTELSAHADSRLTCLNMIAHEIEKCKYFFRFFEKISNQSSERRFAALRLTTMAMGIMAKAMMTKQPTMTVLILC